jgi:hypothetical protein
MIKISNKMRPEVVRFRFLIYIFFICQLSCTKEIPFLSGESSDKFVLNSLFSPENGLIIYLDKTNSILSVPSKNSFNTETRFYEDGICIDSIISIDSVIVLSKNVQLNSVYKIEITFEDENITLSAVDSVPEKVLVSDAQYEYPVYEDETSTRFGRLNFYFQDETGRRNYYEIAFQEGHRYVNTFNVNSSVVSVNTEKDPVHFPVLLFTDEKFQDSEMHFEVFMESQVNPTIILRNVSFNYYMYKSLLYPHLFNQNIDRENVYELFKGDPFDLYSNVTNGLGIFAAYSESRFQSRSLNH